jgi:predicted ATPase/DNA-binding winged helix-turn-helix (wHTH) protein
MDPASEPLASLEFGRFRVLPHRRELLADGRPVKLGGRAFDMLMALIDARGEVISKGALMARVWPDRVVEEKNLHVQISALRTALRAERELIHTVAGRGYQFTGEIRTASAGERQAGVGVPLTETRPPTNLPAPVSELIGRDTEIEELSSLIGAHRLVTLTGSGGIGKTRFALAVARRLLPEFADGVWIAELAPLADPGLVAGTVAAAVGLELAAGTVSPERVADALSGKRLLLVLDNCEHVIDAAAMMAETLLRANPAAHVVATSREPLKAEGEWVYPVSPLAVPAEDAEDADDPLRYGAVRLFVERAQAAQPHFAADRRLAAVIAAICRRLDGIPLAIELAAARVAALGIEELAARLDDRFRARYFEFGIDPRCAAASTSTGELLTGGRRTALPRHQTLRATLDWSYELLAEPERVILRRLAAFAGAFRLEAACAIVASSDILPSEAVEGLLSLVAKSLVSVVVSGPIAGYRLLDTMRAYAFEKLGESGEMAVVASRHAEFYRDLFERAEAEWQTRPSSEWLSEYGRQIDDLRAALDWAFSPGGDASVGVALTTAAIHLWMHLSLLEEWRGRVEQALAMLSNEAKQDARQEMKLYAALGASQLYSRDFVSDAIWTKALEISERLDDVEYQLRALWGLWSFHTGSGQYRTALTLAKKIYDIAANRSDLNDQLIAERLMGVPQHYMGNQAIARRHLERMLAYYVIPDQRSHIIRFQFDQRVMARVLLARILWLQGFPDQAMRTASVSVDDACAANHGMSVCYALAVAACPIALLTGNFAEAEHYVGILLDHPTGRSLPLWRAWARSHQGTLVIKQGDFDTGFQLLRTGLGELSNAKYSFLRVFPAMMAEALGGAGHPANGLAVIEEALQHTDELWLIAELLRIKGELLLLQGAPGAAATAEDHFRQALDWARRQGALSWELRAAMSLARLLYDQARSADALALLQPIYDRFTEGFDTADLKAAKALLDTLE